MTGGTTRVWAPAAARVDLHLPAAGEVRPMARGNQPAKSTRPSTTYLSTSAKIFEITHNGLTISTS